MSKTKKIMRWTILLVSIAMILLGVLRNEAREVMSEAVMLCMECIGIG